MKFEDGNPYGVSHVTGPNNDEEIGNAELNALEHMVERAVHVARMLKAGEAE